MIYNDTRIGLEAGSSSKNKIIVIAGTGSNCFGVNEEGKEAKANGWDYILADEGSGYKVSIKGLRAVMRDYDGRGEKTLLSKTILDELGFKNILDLSEWAYKKPFSKEKLGSLAKTICQTAKMGDKVSIAILAGEAEEALISINTVVQILGLKDKNFDLVFVGGLFKCIKYFKSVLTSKLKEDYPRTKIIPLIDNPVNGAIKLAIGNL